MKIGLLTYYGDLNCGTNLQAGIRRNMHQVKSSNYRD